MLYLQNIHHLYSEVPLQTIGSIKQWAVIYIWWFDAHKYTFIYLVTTMQI